MWEALKGWQIKGGLKDQIQPNKLKYFKQQHIKRSPRLASLCRMVTRLDMYVLNDVHHNYRHVEAAAAMAMSKYKSNRSGGFEMEWGRKIQAARACVSAESCKKARLESPWLCLPLHHSILMASKTQADPTFKSASPKSIWWHRTEFRKTTASIY